MSQVVALISAKGGTGKTSIAVNLAHACAIAGVKVLFIDCDINTYGATAFYRQKECVKGQLSKCITFQEILQNILYPEIYKIDDKKQDIEVEKNLDFIPGGKYLVYNTAEDGVKEQYNKLQESLAKYFDKWIEKYDVLILDQGAGYNSLIDIMVSFATEVLIVREEDKISLGLTRELFEKIRKPSRHIILCINKIPEKKYNDKKEKLEEDILIKCIGFKYDSHFTVKLEKGENIGLMPVLYENIESYYANGSALARIATTVFKEYENNINEYLKNIESQIEEKNIRIEKHKKEKEREELERKREKDRYIAKKLRINCIVPVVLGILGGISFYFIQKETLKLSVGGWASLGVGTLCLIVSGVAICIYMCVHDDIYFDFISKIIESIKIDDEDI